MKGSFKAIKSPFSVEKAKDKYLYTNMLLFCYMKKICLIVFFSIDMNALTGKNKIASFSRFIPSPSTALRERSK